MPPINQDVPLPPSALARLAGASAVWTSRLSVEEMALIKECGLSPAGVVIGTAMQPVGLQTQRWGHSVELGMLTEAMRAGRAVAVERMAAEAEALDATGVVGVTVELVSHEGSADVVEFLATGTAVSGQAGLQASGRPFTTELSGQDLWTLVQNGLAPVGIAMGVCVYHVAHQAMRQGMAPHMEYPPYSQALYDARELALTRLQESAVGAAGVLGVRVSTGSRLWGPHAVEVLATGSSVRVYPTEPPTARRSTRTR